MTRPSQPTQPNMQQRLRDAEKFECDPNCDGTGRDHGQHDCARAGEGAQCFAFCEQCA